MALKKYYIYYILFIFMFCIFSSDVRAISVLKDPIEGKYVRICYNKNDLSYLKKTSGYCSPNGSTVVKKMSDGRRAYCGSKLRQTITGSGSSYKLDNSWSRATGCSYYVKNESGSLIKKNDGLCSEILGFIINEARKGDYGPADEANKIMRAQGSLWTYLAAFTKSPYKDDNGTPSGGWDKNNTIKKILINAWSNYLKAISSTGGSVDENVSEDNMINISKNNVILYYRPNNNSCGTGDYRSEEITIENNTNHSINLKLTYSTSKVEVCSGNICNSGADITLTKKGSGSRSKYSFYLKSSSMITGSDLNISIYASYLESTSRVINETIYDSDRYIYGKDRSYQSMYAVKTNNLKANENIKITHYTEKNISFSYKGVTSRVCSSKNASYANGSYYYPSNSNQQLNKKCANNISDNELRNKKSDYTATFSGCTCKVLNLNGKNVRILINENTEFIYGTLLPNYLYPGGGFGLANTKKDKNGNIIPSEGLLTRYSTNITWSFSDYSGSVPYYFDASNGVGDDASKLTNQIVNKLKNDLSTNLKLNVNTRDSNEGDYSNVKENNDYKINLDFRASGIDYDSSKKKFSKVYYVSLAKAYFSADGRVSYSKNEVFKDEADNKYYIPTDYTVGIDKEQLFPFNITKSNLSISKYFNFEYSAKCSVKVSPYDLNGDLVYRSIAEDNPFPRYIPVNWIDWYKINKNRIYSSFNNYPDNPLYRISFSDNEISRILKDDISYTNWKNMNEDGSSKYVSNYFNKKANKSSYCRIGEFSSSCDK